MPLTLNLRGWRSFRQLLLGYTPADMAEYLAVRDSWRAGRVAARQTRRTGIDGAAAEGFIEGLANPMAFSSNAPQHAMQEPDPRNYDTWSDVVEARRAMRAKRDARLNR